jgi:hypothetical protein
METFESLSKYCSENDRAVPQPDTWNAFFSMLKNTHQKPSGSWEPSLPLILSAWWSSSPREKVSRFQEHLKWAANEGQLEEVGQYLRSLPEECWAHFSDLPS